MNGVVVLDANLLVLLVVGSASRDYIGRHKRLSRYSTEDFDLLALMIGQFDEIVLLPHIVAEVSSLCRQIPNPARSAIQRAFKVLVTTATEIPVPSADGALRAEFEALGVTDACVLHLCAMSLKGVSPTLITMDGALANAAHSLGYSVIDYSRDI